MIHRLSSLGFVIYRRHRAKNFWKRCRKPLLSLFWRVSRINYRKQFISKQKSLLTPLATELKTWRGDPHNRCSHLWRVDCRSNQSGGKCSFNRNLWKNAERRLFSWLIELELLCIRIDQLTSTWIDFQLKFSGLLPNCAWRRWKIKLIARGWCLWTEINVPWRETSHNYVIKFNSLCGFTRCDVLARRMGFVGDVMFLNSEVHGDEHWWRHNEKWRDF